jgi:hypothetical protein
MDTPRLRRAPDARTFSVEKLLQLVQDGAIRVPAFQRPLRWRSSHVRDLFDSIYRGYPIGELLLSKRHAPPSVLHYGTHVIDAGEVHDAFLVVDGQQRINALAGTLLRQEPRPRGDIHAVWFDLEAEEFFTAVRASPNAVAIPLNVVNNSVALLRWLSKWAYREERPELVDRALELGKAIREYPIPAYIVEAGDEILKVIFTRANTTGVSMKESEVFEALASDASQPRPIESACARLQTDTSFGNIDRELFLRCLKLVERLELRERVGEEHLDRAGTEAIARTEDALQRAIGLHSHQAFAVPPPVNGPCPIFSPPSRSLSAGPNPVG